MVSKNLKTQLPGQRASSRFNSNSFDVRTLGQILLLDFEHDLFFKTIPFQNFEILESAIMKFEIQIENSVNQKISYKRFYFTQGQCSMSTNKRSTVITAKVEEGDSRNPKREVTIFQIIIVVNN